MASRRLKDVVAAPRDPRGICQVDDSTGLVCKDVFTAGRSGPLPTAGHSICLQNGLAGPRQAFTLRSGRQIKRSLALPDTRQLLELTALRAMLASARRPVPRRSDWPLSEEVQRQGWMAIRGLQRSWCLDLKPALPNVTAGGRSGREDRVVSGAYVAAPMVSAQMVLPTAVAQERAVAAASELFVCEPAIRLWCLLLAEYAEAQACETARQFERNLISAHGQVRNLALEVVASQPVRGQDSGAALDRLRRIGERWTDLILAGRLAHPRAAELVFDLDRAEEFSERLRLQPAATRPSAAWELALVSVRTVYPAFPAANEPRRQLLRGLSEALLATFPEQAFSSEGAWLPEWAVAWPGRKPSLQ
jgi:hypothetical protein